MALVRALARVRSARTELETKLLPGEDPHTSVLEDILFWVKVYQELSAAMERVRLSSLDNVPAFASRELELYRARLAFWQQRFEREGGVE